jgi:acyl-CoA reductase-like NAD-dependent aldehyde dehydrogenase
MEMQMAERRRFAMLIGGALVHARGDAWLESVDPSNGRILGFAPRGDREDVEAAVEAAVSAQPAWDALGPEGRRARLEDLCAGVLERREEIAELEARDSGNPITQVRADIEKAVRRTLHLAGIGVELKGETFPASRGGLHVTVREPYGVVGRILAFNHPFAFALSRIAAPLAAGNTVIVKPSELCPLSPLLFGEICAARLPAGVVNIMSGLGCEVGDAIIRHPRLKRIGFIGSRAVGLEVQRAAAAVSVKHVTLELGGKNAMLVFPDADLPRALDAAVAGMALGCQGQSCGATSRLLLPDVLHDRFLEGLIRKLAAVRIGPPLDAESAMGPLVSEVHRARVLDAVELGRKEGARLETGGDRPQGPEFRDGFWLRPAVLSGVRPEMRIAHEEIFGPVLSVLRWSEPEEAVRIANSVESGLTASIFTGSLRNALWASKRLEAGYIWVNGVGTHFPGVPFGGMKESGVGREEGFGELLSYTEEKAIHFLD